ncbi:transcription termination/antitermination protein NusG [Mycetocola zhujimingii]|uniref:Transcription termination/antitermination protein NusG n=1 Tax=Mycetocola zhujimingii TaxID=2079792 RepID=A0A2U1TA53_9MICO|nr:transcription termination/antitermination protein NusG [Mycetocola zhujimingii]AWB85551.1 transcription termination/antitermination protein NusG [Mycetocola zhujimingii]PWC04551.1 transcription termination/antitermination protein NusG [Mycetocola zhujimingii]
MSERNLDDVDWSTAAEQSSEDDEAQEGNVLAAEENAVTPAEHEALHIEDTADVIVDVEEEVEALAEAVDPEADAIVDDALEIDEAAEAEAAALALADSIDVEREEEAEFEPEVAPYDGEEPDAGVADVEADAAGDEADAEDADPYDAFRKELRSLPGKWFVIHSYAGFERKVKANIEQRKGSLDVADYIYQVEVPMEDVVEIKNGQRKMVTRVRIPGYVLVRMDLNEDSWSVVRHTPGVTGFVGNAHNPTPLRFEEAFNMLKSLVEVKEAAQSKATGAKGGQTARSIPAEVDFEIGETITIKEGSFAGLPGSISEIKPESGKLIVLVSLFERETPVELSFDQVTKL